MWVKRPNYKLTGFNFEQPFSLNTLIYFINDTRMLITNGLSNVLNNCHIISYLIFVVRHVK